MNQKKPGEEEGQINEVQETPANLLGSARRTRSILAYYLPVIVVAVLAIAAFTFLASWLSAQAANQRQLDLTRALATAVQGEAEAAVVDKFNLLNTLLRESFSVPYDKAGVQAVARRLEQQLGGVARVKLVSATWTDEQVLDAVEGSFAAADKFQQILDGKTKTPAEVIPSHDGKRYITVAGPVVRGGRIVGVLFLEFPLEPLKQRVEALNLEEAGITLEQAFADGSMLLAGSGQKIGKIADGIIPVADTLWQVRYKAPINAGLGWKDLAMLLVTGAMLMLGITFLGYLSLARVLRKDMDMMVALVDATLKQQGAPRLKPHLKEAAPAMDLLVRYAQATWDKKRISHTLAKGGRPPADQGMEVEEVPAEAAEAAAQSGKKKQAALAEEKLPLTIFRPNLIRGRAETDITEEVARALGAAVGSMVLDNGERMVILGRDNRAHSDAYASALATGVLSTGCDVLDLGEVPTPLLNYALRNGPTTSGVMVTGGHNLAAANGFKIYLQTKPLQEDAYLELRQRIIEGDFRSGAGRLDRYDFSQEYIDRLTADVQLVEPLKVVIDGSNGIAGPLAVRLFEAMGCEVVPLNCEPDGNFPGHAPDPSDPTALQPLMNQVRASGAQLGVVLDGDGDALGVVDDQGRPVASDRLLMLLAEDVIRRNPGADVLYDVAASARIPEFVLSNGGRPIMWKCGHARIQAQLAETGALVAGETSGHFYFNDRWCGCDDGLYAAARLLEILSLAGLTLSDMLQSGDTDIVSTPLIRLPLPPGAPDKVLSHLLGRGDYEGADVVQLDGLRLEYADGWGLVRASGTESALVFRFEGKDEAALAAIQQRFRDFLGEVMPDAAMPF